jgi:hypothetical protein
MAEHTEREPRPAHFHMVLTARTRSALGWRWNTYFAAATTKKRDKACSTTARVVVGAAPRIHLPSSTAGMPD